MIGSVFRNRDEAGAALAEVMAKRVSGPATVLAIPRGGVAVALPVARSLQAPLDVVIPRKLRAPDNPELAIGAVAPGVMVLHERAVRQLRVPPEYIDREAARQEAEISAARGRLPRRAIAGAGRRPNRGGRGRRRGDRRHRGRRPPRGLARPAPIASSSPPRSGHRPREPISSPRRTTSSSSRSRSGSLRWGSGTRGSIRFRTRRWWRCSDGKIGDRR